MISMDTVAECIRWWSLFCYFTSLMILLYKFVFSVTLCRRRCLDWVKLVLGLHLFLGFFSLGEILYTNVEWGWRTFLTLIVCTLTLWVAIFKVKVRYDCSP